MIRHAIYNAPNDQIEECRSNEFEQCHEPPCEKEAKGTTEQQTPKTTKNKATRTPQEENPVEITQPGEKTDDNTCQLEDKLSYTTLGGTLEDIDPSLAQRSQEQTIRDSTIAASTTTFHSSKQPAQPARVNDSSSPRVCRY